jgi:hypothetical protein
LKKTLISLFFLLFWSKNIFSQEKYSTLAESKPLESPMILMRKEKIKNTLLQEIPVLKIDERALNQQQIEAQNIALASPQFLNKSKDALHKTPYLNEIFGILPARPSDFSAQSGAECSDGSCFRVEMYNYALNLSTIALVHVNSKKIIRMGEMPSTQPDISPELKNIALHIATESPEVEKALGFKPSPNAALMPDTKTALNRSRCERSRHLCVAPTFVKGEKALWAVVDLTEMRLVGTRWTNVGAPQQAATERRIQNENITECFCKKMNTLEKNDWKLNYVLTSSDGLRVSEVEYKNERVINSAKLVDWHVSYSNTDGFGYSDAVGCPFFSAAAVIAVESPKVLDLVENDQVVGFVLEQSYYSEGWPTACNYNYKQRFEFFNDGRFRVAAASLGRGCGNNGTYRPVTRIAFTGKQKFSEYDGKTWSKWEKEKWNLQTETTPLSKDGTQYKLENETGKGFEMMANVGKFSDGGRGDNAWVFVTKNNPNLEEGESDLITIGPCCNSDYHQGPEKFIEPNPESIDNESIVVWYVAQMKNDDREGNQYCWAESFLENGVFKTKVYPCFSGAMWIPIK